MDSGFEKSVVFFFQSQAEAGVFLSFFACFFFFFLFNLSYLVHRNLSEILDLFEMIFTDRKNLK